MVGVLGPNAIDGPAPGLVEAGHAIYRGSGRKRVRRIFVVAVLIMAALTLALELFLRRIDYGHGIFESTSDETVRRWIELTSAGIFEEIADPVRRYAMSPGKSCVVDGWTFRISSHRTRGPEFPAEKPAGERRLLCLGDSFAFGLWCDEDETLVSHLTRMANAAEERRGSGTIWRPIDLGVPGYHSGQQLRALEQEGLALDPDVVVLYFNTKDIERAGFFYVDDLGALRRDYLPLPTWLRRRLWASHLYGWIATQHKNHVESRPAAHMDPDVPYAHVRADNQAATRTAIERIAAICRERRIPLVFVNQPLMTYMGDARRRDWNVLPLVAWAEDLRAELDLPGVSLLGWMRGYADGVDRMEGIGPGDAPPPPDFLLDAYFADERVQEAVRFAKERAREAGRSWEELSFGEQIACFTGYGKPLPREMDFHLTGEGYGHVARVVYARMQSAGILP